MKINPYEEPLGEEWGLGTKQARKEEPPIYYHNTWNECPAIHWDDLGVGYLLEP